jgi:hypothetical protein
VRGPVGSDEGPREQLEARAHAERDRAAAHRHAEPVVVAQALVREHHRRVLAAAQHVDVAVARQRVVQPDRRDVAPQPAGAGPVRERHHVAAIAVRPEDDRVDEHHVDLVTCHRRAPS